MTAVLKKGECRDLDQLLLCEIVIQFEREKGGRHRLLRAIGVFMMDDERVVHFQRSPRLGTAG